MASIDPAPFLQSLKIIIPAPNSPTSTTLTSAITKALTHLGYDSHLIQRVALLTSSNTHTVECSGLQALLHHPSRTYGTQHALEKLFCEIQAKHAKTNTNEPVLLINSLGGLDASVLQEIADAAASTLRSSHHIRPIRVYAGKFTPITGDEKEAGFSISLLNVVNTDIGGPGMVQLLDMADWKANGAVRREHYDGSGWNLMEKEDHETGYEDVKAEDLSESGGSEDGEWDSELETGAKGGDLSGQKEEMAEAMQDAQKHAEKIDALEAVRDGPDSDQHIDETEPPTTDPPEAKVISDLPDEGPSSQRPKLADIKRPSWESEHDNESLLDMIGKQSQRLPISRAGNAYATAATKEKAYLSGEDEYEVL